MKIKENAKEKQFDTVKTFREIKEKIAREMDGMNFDEIKEYLKKNSLKFRTE